MLARANLMDRLPYQIEYLMLRRHEVFAVELPPLPRASQRRRISSVTEVASFPEVIGPTITTSSNLQQPPAITTAPGKNIIKLHLTDTNCSNGNTHQLMTYHLLFYDSFPKNVNA